ncbi:hypothetical protein Harman_25490 [Haloarcula mannanilytica]|uniref:Uncharacterized protein n=1 Tax=Haloarcula mannanilytica TaxID=2509225 RepID=A0A4C2EJF1_9EURY|nr:hypothetical protein [Haloarcula mannanilytica]GCF14614.1 hypothetical protein Harman_25490 [Haloarcula mannanilytica]
MNDFSGNVTANLVDVVRNAYNYIDDFRPQTKSIRYNYRESTSEMTFLIEVPDSRKRLFGDVKIPISEGYRVKEMFALPDYTPVRAVYDVKDGYITFNPSELPSQDEYILTLNGDVEPETLKEIVHLKAPEDPKRKEEEDAYWVHSAIKKPGLMKDIYDDMKVDNVDISMQVGVQRCFSNAIPDDVLEVFDRTRELLDASNEDDRNQVISASRRRYQARRDINTSPAEAAEIIRSLATADNIQDYITVDDPFRERNINPGQPEQNIFPENISVDVTTDLSLDQQAVDGNITFRKKSFQNFVEEKTDNEIL